NGFKRPQYIKNISDMLNGGWHNIIPVLDNKNELEDLDDLIEVPTKLGIRIASEEEPSFDFYTS
ncbi:MAG TPA: arginine decarboxylase, partial [Rikenellaceae bacterium]|nr:arginine decarboxylase [Rikenellaceae bacterium]